jgi:hypothetical protein
MELVCITNQLRDKMNMQVSDNKAMHTKQPLRQSAVSTYKQEGSNTQDCHDSNHLRQDNCKNALITGTEKVIPTQQQQAIYSTRPSINQKQQKVFQVGRPNTVIHPRTMVVHSTYASMTNSAVMRVRWFVCLALGAQDEFREHQSLGFRRHGSKRNTSWVCQ